MRMKKYLACLTAALLMACTAAACGNQNSGGTSVAETTAAETTAAETTVAETTTEAETAVEVTKAVEFENAVDAKPGQAYLAIVDGQWWIQYWGSSTDGKGYMLAYDAGIADIQGDGTYTVSVTADTNGFRFDTTGDPEDQYVPEGLSFMAIRIDQGQELYPAAVITVDSIKVDGKEIELKAKNYTSSDDGVELRTNIFNSYVPKPSNDARSVEGNLYDEDGNAADFCENYSAQIVDTANFSQWTTVEVTFTITDTGSAGTAHAGDESETTAEGETTAEEATAAEGETTAEETTTAAE